MEDEKDGLLTSYDQCDGYAYLAKYKKYNPLIEAIRGRCESAVMNVVLADYVSRNQISNGLSELS